MRKSILTLTVMSIALSACQSMKSETVSYTSPYAVPYGFGIGDETLPSFMSSAIIVDLSGKLWLPEGEGPFPVVLWGHPTTISESLAKWRRDLRDGLIAEGIGVFFNNSYAGRGLPRKATGRYLNSYSRYVDAVRALEALAKHPKIDPERIGISGASFGANVAMRLQWEAYMAQMQPDGLRYAAHVPIYPPCNAIIKDYKSTGAPMLILIGEKDWNYASRCEDRAAELRQAGGQIDLVIYPGAYHCFISTMTPRMVNAPVYGDCGTETIDKAKGFSMRNLDTVKGGYPGCIKPQGMCGSNRAATADALKRTVAFFAEHLRK